MLHPWIRDYILLALRIDKLVRKSGDWFVDTYYGPTVLKETVEVENDKSPYDLIRAAVKLTDSLYDQGFEPQRTQYLSKQVRAMDMIGRILNNEKIPLEEQVQSCLDINPEWIPEDYFEQGLELYNQALPGTGNIRDRYNAWYERNKLSKENVDLIKEIVTNVLSEVHKRTQTFFDLPEGEGIEIQTVTGKKWGAANWYLGNFRSLMELNIDLPINLFSLLHLMSHEVYPGHHTEFSLKEKYLLRELKYSEQLIFIINSPQLVISEGIAEMAFEMIFTPEEAAKWLEENLYAKLGIKIDDVDLPKLFQASSINRIDQISGNAVIMLRNGCPEEQVVQYIIRYTLQTEENARKIVDSFKSSPYRKIYPFAYFMGKHLIQQLVKSQNKVEIFQRLLTEQVYPSLLVRWVKKNKV